MIEVNVSVYNDTRCVGAYAALVVLNPRNQFCAGTLLNLTLFCTSFCIVKVTRLESVCSLWMFFLLS